MSTEGPTSQDNIIDFLAKERRRNPYQFHVYSLSILACCPNGQDPEDDRVLLFKQGANFDSPTTWRIPQVEDLADRPGSLGFQDTLEWIAWQYRVRRLPAWRGQQTILPFRPFLCFNKVTPPADAKDGAHGNTKATLRITIIVGYEKSCRVTIDPHGDGFGLISMARLRDHEEAIGDPHDLATIKLAVERYHSLRRANCAPLALASRGPRTNITSNIRIAMRRAEDEGCASG